MNLPRVPSISKRGRDNPPRVPSFRRPNYLKVYYNKLSYNLVDGTTEHQEGLPVHVLSWTEQEEGPPFQPIIDTVSLQGRCSLFSKGIFACLSHEAGMASSTARQNLFTRSERYCDFETRGKSSCFN